MGEEIVKDPVCGMEKPKAEMKYSSVFGGKTYYFCSQGDKNLFDAYPDKWIPKKGGDEKL